MPVFLHPPAGEVRSGSCITVGLINNMPDEALKATERQYTSLLGSASGGMQIHLTFYALPGVPRNQASSRHIAARYSSIEDLWEGQLDGLIVTGREPLAARLMDEPYWESFTRTLAWAQENAHSTVWSCLAAHAAILYMDGISRVKSDDKLFGVFGCTRLTDHPLMAGTPSRLELPHSRWNGLPEVNLKDCGYRILTFATDAGIDTFVKQQKKLFVFFQGHPEYETDSLLREYRRDIGRYFKGETSEYPSLPRSYFDRETVDKLTALQPRSPSERNDALLTQVTAALSNPSVENTWQSSATSIYTNWLRYLGAGKEKRERSKRITTIFSSPEVRWADTVFERWPQPRRDDGARQIAIQKAESLEPLEKEQVE